ncbi:MAG: hypothetical protein O3C07_04085 [Bacteroidetes bacterium]|nr:hypothetical protein [Bacteroidota bacterium]
MYPLFFGRTLVVATMHGKEQVIAPILERSLGVKVLSENTFDTDQFGTFSGEVDRKGTPMEVARAKCEAAMSITGADLAIASEGSFGPHPELFFAAADHELLLFVDHKNQIECSDTLLSTSTNFSKASVPDLGFLKSFADQVNFPSHALILKVEGLGNSTIKKGIRTLYELEKTYEELVTLGMPITVETDMRAMYNPTRMGLIGQLAEKLVSKILNSCPSCNFPAFDIVSKNIGLPCRLCHFPTKSFQSYPYKCISCGYHIEIEFPNHKRFEDPTFCDFCNP